MKNSFPLGKTKPNLNYAFLESCCSYGFCLKRACSQGIPTAGEQWGDQGDRARTEAVLPWPVSSAASISMSNEASGQDKAIFFSSVNSAWQWEQLLRKLFGEAGAFGRAVGS